MGAGGVYEIAGAEYVGTGAEYEGDEGWLEPYEEPVMTYDGAGAGP